MALNPKESGEFIVKNAQYLSVDEKGIEVLAYKIVEGIVDGSLDVRNFSQHQFHPQPSDVNAFNWIFLIDTLNFCFWTNEEESSEKWTVEGQTGYFALCAAIKRSLRNNIDITNPKYYSTLTSEALEEILSSDTSVKAPLIPERLQCLKEVGEKLIEKYEGNFVNVIKSAGGSAKRLLEIIVEEFPCFRDEAVYKGSKVAIYKRAQILVGDVYAFTKGEGLGAFEDLNESITMFADYRIPQVLVHFGAMVYKPELMEDLKANKILQNGDPKEVEIRGASIYVVEKAKEKVLEILNRDHPGVSTKQVNSVLIDHYLWDYRRAHADTLSVIPFHKTFSIYY